MIEHASLANLINWHVSEYEVNEQSISTCMAGVAFDAFGWELFPYLVAGATIHLLPNTFTFTGANLVQFCIYNNITHAFVSTALVPGFIGESNTALPHLKQLLTGGDKLPPVNTSALSYRLINNYGPTENTVVATSYVLPKTTNTQVPYIGKPVSNMHLYIVDGNHQLVPVGVPGQICLAGIQLARGYFGNADLTNQQFVPNPYATGNNQRMYLTGDVGRWTTDGNVEYLGRFDEQVKVRGYRIELGEIESQVLQTGLVTQTVVVVKNDATVEKLLVGYVVANNNYLQEALIGELRKKLPEFMVPLNWMVLLSLPLTPNGKIDKKALPSIDLANAGTATFVAPSTKMELQLAGIWSGFLNIETIGIHDNFFELGGHSLLAMRLIATIKEQLGIDVAVKEVFEFSTIAELSRFLEVKSASIISTCTPDEFDEMVI